MRATIRDNKGHPLLGNGSLNTLPQKQTRRTIGDLLLGSGAVNRFCQQYRLCFPWGPCKVDVRESNSEVVQLLKKRDRDRSVNKSNPEPVVTGNGAINS
jgi:hypothetical protein